MLKEEIANIFEKNGYSTYLYKGCFDVAAKKENIFLIKTFYNVDAFQRTQAKNIKLLSNNFDAYPLVVGLHTRREKLEKGVIYERFETPVLSLESLEDFITSNILPCLFRNKGGLYIAIDPLKLRQGREAKAFTQKRLSEILKINKKTIYEHERSIKRMDIEIAKKLENVLDCNISCNTEFLRNNFFIHGEPETDFEFEVDSEFKRLGFETDFVKQSPVDVIMKEKIILASNIGDNTKIIKKRFVLLKTFMSFMDIPAFIVAKKKVELEIPVVEKKELERFETGKELIKNVRKE